MTRTGGRWIHICHTNFNVYSWGRQRSFFKIFFKLIMILFKVEKEKDGATIKSKKNAEGRKVRLNISALVALFYPCGGGTWEFIHKERLLRLEKETERQRDRNTKTKKNSILWCQGIFALFQWFLSTSMIFRFGCVRWSPQCLQASSGKSCRFLSILVFSNFLIACYAGFW